MNEDDRSKVTEAKLATAYVESSPDGVLAVDDAGTIVLANGRCESIFGYQQGQLMGRSIEDLIPTPVVSAHRAYRDSYHNSHRRRDMGRPGSRFFGQRVDGAIVPVDVALNPVEIDGQQMTLVIVRDLTMRVKAETEHSKVRQILDAVGEAVFLFEPDTLAYTYANTGAVDQVGYSRDELTRGMTPLDLLADVDADWFRAQINELTADRLPSLFLTAAHRRSDGTELPVDLFIQYPKLGAGAERGVVAIAHDATEREQAAAALRSSEKAFRSAFADAPVAMVLTDVTGEETIEINEITEVNGAFTRLLGYGKDVPLPRTLQDIIHPEDFSPIGPSSPPFRAQLRFAHADGRYLWCAVHVSPIETSSDHPRVISHIVDVSRRVEAEHERDNRQSLLAALAEIRRASLSQMAIDEVLQVSLTTTGELANAAHSFIVVPSPNGRSIYRCMVTDHGPDRSGQTVGSNGLFARAVAEGRTITVEDLCQHGDICSGHDEEESCLGPAVLSPCGLSGPGDGLLVVARCVDQPPFGEDEIANITTIASEIGVTVALDDARATRRWRTLVQDRERIAHDLHDTVIQRLYATGMSLSSALGAPDQLPAKASETIEELDATINVIRDTIFDINNSTLSTTGEVNQLISRYQGSGLLEINLSVEGNLDAIPQSITDHLIPTLSELLSNVERHSGAKRVDVDIRAADQLTLTVSDNGFGIRNDHRTGFGIGNLTSRADYLNGTFTIESSHRGQGTVAHWAVPIPPL